MKFNCEKAILQAAISVTSRAVSLKSSIPSLEGILLEADENLQLTGYNLEMGIRTVVSADIQQKGSLVLSSRLFGEIIRKMPDDIVAFQTDGCMVNIKCGLSEFNIMGIQSDEFPELPSIDKENAFNISQKNLKSMISQTLFAVSDNESRPVQTGSLFEVDETELTIVSVDGYRLALRKENIDRMVGGAAFSFVVPGSALGEVEKICVDSDELTTVTQGTRHITFQIGQTMLISRRLEGEFLDYTKAIPRNNPIRVEGDTKELLTSIDRVSLIINENNKSPLRCVFDKNELRISSRTAIGDAADCCALVGDGTGLEIGFNNRYLMEALKAAPSQRVRMELDTGVTPCVILPSDQETNFLYMVLPVRLKAGE